MEAHTKVSPACIQMLAAQFTGGLGYENPLSNISLHSYEALLVNFVNMLNI